MKISTNKKIENGVYIAAIAVTDFSENDRKLISKFGEPELELGGHFPEVPAVPSHTVIELTANPAVCAYVTVLLSICKDLLVMEVPRLPGSNGDDFSPF